jgi:hypothetical protein
MFWRAHYPDCPEFSSENASSAPWSAEEESCTVCRGTGFITRNGYEDECPKCGGTGVTDIERQRGYSCCESRKALVRYFESRGGLPDDCPIVVFGGDIVGFGMDNEPLVVPRDFPRPRWTTWGRVRRSARL